MPVPMFATPVRAAAAAALALAAAAAPAKTLVYCSEIGRAHV